MTTENEEFSVKKFSSNLYEELQNDLVKYTSDLDNINSLKISISLVRNALHLLRNFVASYNFNDNNEEIEFFRYSKPVFYSQYIYFIDVYNIEAGKPEGSMSNLISYYQNELDYLKLFFEHNHLFYQYYRSKSSHLDASYFVQGVFCVHTELDDFDHDGLFSTSHDYKLSKIIAHERLRDYLLTEIFKVEQNQSILPDDGKNIDLEWTAPKAGLVELLYAFHAAGTFNNGAVSIRQVAEFTGKAFNVKLGDYYRLFQDFRIRKKDRTKFLNYLIERLTARMDEMDE